MSEEELIRIEAWLERKNQAKKDGKFLRATLDDAPGFVGWGFIESVANEAMQTRYYWNPHPFLPLEWRELERDRLRRFDKALIAAMILLGGRVQEILMTHAAMFDFEGDFIRVSGMPVLKRIKKRATRVQVLRELPDSGIIPNGYNWSNEYQAFVKREWVTASVIKEREPFPVPRWEPLTDTLLEWVDQAEAGPGGHRWLFPTPAEPKRDEDPGVQALIQKRFKLDSRAWISHERAWQKITDLGKRRGVKLWDHWFRNQRASQLTKQYGFSERHLNRFFGWAGGWESQRRSTASQYAKSDYYELTGLMYQGRNKVKEVR